MFVLFPLLTAAWGAPPPPLVGGHPTEEYAAVGVLTATVDEERVPFCSCSLVSPQVVLTAAHCLEVIAEAEDMGLPVEVVFGDRLQGGDPLLAAVHPVQTFAHPNWDPDTLAHDLALVILDEAPGLDPLPLAEAEAPAALADGAATFVGWGVTGDLRHDGGIKRAVTLPIEDITDLYLYTFDPTHGWNLCSGDSGGPALVESDGQPAIVGVASLVFADRPDGAVCAGGHGRAARVDIDRDWIIAKADRSVGSGGVADLGPAVASGGGLESKSGACQTSPGGALPTLLLLIALCAPRRR